ncbi:hypothetical protein [Paraburkholderia kururiensis]|uniref:Uncharacterized protein n=1 Tax=Paraburkholderia kururiensis TaxID=984307 RepID=A0ABZ0WIU8_9BURK|nr:hypothetical protein [Paraburkholderia kururiensis]WQD77253.1 hypothetical protein U0042_24845 [Paraburkholderia kururiensis]
MNNPHTIRLPGALRNGRETVAVAGRLDDEQFASCQVAFLQAVFGHADYLRSRARPTPVADAFLSAMVNLLEGIALNDTSESTVCREQLVRIIAALSAQTASRGG